MELVGRGSRHPSEEEEEDRDNDNVDKTTMCGLCNWRPKCLQRFANHYAYSVAFILTGIVQGMSQTYYNGNVTTLEKSFHIDSRTMGFIFVGNDLSTILCGMLLSHVGSRGNRPFWMAMGILIGALSCFIFASTIIFWKEDLLTTMSLSGNGSELMTTLSGNVEFCSTLNDSNVFGEECNANGGSGAMKTAILWLFLGQFVAGIGGTATYSVGFAYMDDHVSKGNSPLFVGLTAALKSSGPTFGFLLASFCLNIYIKPNDVPQYGPSDSRWLGAWWLGFLLIGILQILLAVPILLFPQQLPSARKQIELTAQGTSTTTNQTDAKVDEEEDSTWTDFLPSLKRLAFNPIIVANVLAWGVFALPTIGIATFMPKYLEARFGQTASQANILTGLSSTTMVMVGTFLGGLVMWKFKPKPVYVTSWIAFTDFMYVLSLTVVMNLDCNDVTLVGIDFEGERPRVTSTCSQSCNCQLTFEPVCVGSENFLSPCLAGCTSIDTTTIFNVTTKIFSNCSCGSTMDYGTNDFCESSQSGVCPNLWTYLIVLSLTDMISTTAHVGCVMIIVRSVAEKDKGVAMSLLTASGRILGYIPGMIIYGTVVDFSCLIWEETPCDGDNGGKGNCWFYDVDAFSRWFHGIGVVLISVTVFLDIVVIFRSRHLNFYSETSETEESDKRLVQEVMFSTRKNSIKSPI